ncbi:MAG: GAF domain-containing protein [Acidobacteriota bacterium]
MGGQRTERSQGADGDEVRARGEELRNMFSRARAFTEELLRENERLRFRIAGLAREVERGGARRAAPPDEAAALRARVEALERERDDLLRRFREVEAMNRSFAERYQQIETQNNQLANLYVASYQLHATLNYGEVIATVKEILINLVGAGAFALLWVDERRGCLHTEASEGVGAGFPETVSYRSEPLAGAVLEGRSFYADPLPRRSGIEPTSPIACIPLRIADRVIGVVAIYGLLQQKSRFTPIDFEMFTLLGGHAATALFGSKLFQQSEQKLSNLQGFVNMLTAPANAGP